MQSITIIRGLPGAGKSTLASSIALIKSAIHIEADQFFVDEKGQYNYDGMKIGQAHDYCKGKAFDCLSNRMSVVISNTFTTSKELRPYFDIGREFSIVPQVITLHSNYGSIHSVPEEVISRMNDRFCYNIDSLYKEYNDCCV